MSESWVDRWQDGRIGWHELHGNPSLRKYWAATGRRVLVPLCGKSYDLCWLEAQGNEVVGVELSEIAVRAFFDENEIEYRLSQRGLRCFSAVDRNIHVVCGDYFDVDCEQFDACYDRGALVALDAEMRRRYVQHTNSLLAEKPYHLVITLEYDQAVCAGPPFSVPEDELRSHWPDLARLSVAEDIDNCPPKFRQAGLISVNEVIWRSS